MELLDFEIGATIPAHNAFNILRRDVFVFQIPGVKNLYRSVCHLQNKCKVGLDRMASDPSPETSLHPIPFPITPENIAAQRQLLQHIDSDWKSILILNDLFTDEDLLEFNQFIDEHYDKQSDIYYISGSYVYEQVNLKDNNVLQEKDIDYLKRFKNELELNEEDPTDKKSINKFIIPVTAGWNKYNTFVPIKGEALEQIKKAEPKKLSDSNPDLFKKIKLALEQSPDVEKVSPDITHISDKAKSKLEELRIQKPAEPASTIDSPEEVAKRQVESKKTDSVQFRSCSYG